MGANAGIIPKPYNISVSLGIISEPRDISVFSLWNRLTRQLLLQRSSTRDTDACERFDRILSEIHDPVESTL